MSHAEDQPRTHCPNCGASLRFEPPPKFCPSCGQETALHPPSLGEFLHEFVGHYVALEGALWRTLLALVLKPGRLTREYLAGRRRHYVLPLRLYLSASFVFFLVVKVFGAGAGLGITFAAGVTPDGKPVAISSSPAEVAQMRRCIDEPGVCNWFERQAARVGYKAASRPGEQQAIGQRMGSMAPYAVFLMLPLFAGIVMAAYRSRRMVYGEHFVFSLHMHSFWFLMLLLSALLPESAGGVVLFATAGYGIWAMHHVYRGRWWATLLRAAVVTALYGLAIVLGSAALVVIAVLLG